MGKGALRILPNGRRLVQFATENVNKKKMFLQLAPNACYRTALIFNN